MQTLVLLYLLLLVVNQKVNGKLIENKIKKQIQVPNLKKKQIS